MWLILIIIIITMCLIVGCIKSLLQTRVTKNTIVAFTGSLGTGKTYHAVKFAIKAYKRQRLLYWLKMTKDYPTLYSNIPIKINRKRWANQLTREHLLLENRLPEKAIIVIDEIGQFASQYDYDNPNVMLQFQELIRFYRHYTDGRIFITDQATGNIVIPLRRRISQVYNLTNMRRSLIFFYKVDVQIVEFTEEITNIQGLETDKKDYFYGLMPFKLPLLNWYNKFFFKKYYDSRCYSINYDKVEITENDKIFNKYKTNEFIDLSASAEQIQLYKNKKKGK